MSPLAPQRRQARIPWLPLLAALAWPLPAPAAVAAAGSAWSLALVAGILLLILLPGGIAYVLLRRRSREMEALAKRIEERERDLHLALWGARESFWDYDLETDSLTVTFWPGDDISRKQVLPVEIHPDDLPIAHARLRQHLTDPGNAMLFSRQRIRTPGSGWHWVSARGRTVKRNANGRVAHISGTARDVTERIESERAQRIAGEIVHNMLEAVVVLDSGFRVVSTNESFSTMTGFDAESMQGMTLDRLFDTRHGHRAGRGLRETLLVRGRWDGELWQRHRNGRDLLCHVRAATVPDKHEAGEGMHYVLVLSDITEQRRTEQDLRQLANYDPLTRLPNRSLFTRKLAETIASHSEDKYFALLFLDLDRFKDINDSLGHLIGDQVLCAAADRLRELVPSQHLVARLGGDEFTVILRQLDRAEDALHHARRVLDGFSEPLVLRDGLEFGITPSIGISLFPEDGVDAHALVRKADTAMYRAKAAGRQTFARYEPDMDVQSRHRLQHSMLLRGAIERGEMLLHFQPRWSLREKRYTGVEALLRWRHPELGLVPPTEFIPLAEESGLIHELGHWVAQEACKTLAAWEAAGLTGLRMAVNVSSVQLLRDGFPGTVAACIAESGLQAGQLELEITESVLLDNPQLASARLRELESIGVHLAIDDFGTGYSSLAYLRGLPIDRLKIDRAFVADLAVRPRDAAIVVAIITMAHSMDMDVVAEGVETAEQLQMLAGQGCDEVQGFHVARPMPAAACEALLRRPGPLDPARAG